MEIGVFLERPFARRLHGTEKLFPLNQPHRTNEMNTNTLNNTDDTHWIAFDEATRTVCGVGATYAECETDTLEWMDTLEGIEFEGATEAAYSYAVANGGDSASSRFERQAWGVRLAD